MKYKQINKLSAMEGDIVRVVTGVWDMSISPNRDNNFVWRPKWYRIVKINNDSTASCKDHFRVLHRVNMTYNGITVYRKMEVA